MRRTGIIKRSVVILGRKTSVSLEDEFWAAFRAIARGRDTTVSALAGEIDAARRFGNLSSAIRLFVLAQVSAPAAPPPEQRAP